MIIISHPHFYTYVSHLPQSIAHEANFARACTPSLKLTCPRRTWADWSATFNCPVYMTKVDSPWANRQSHPTAHLKLLTAPTTELLPGLNSITCGGHFPGSQVLHSSPPNTSIPTLFVADTIFAVASGHNPDPGKRKDTISYQFLWSIPNFVPLPPDDVLMIWRALRPWEFKATYGVMARVTNVCESSLPNGGG
jgi:hypothetical protein